MDPRIALLAVLLTLAGCATVPAGVKEAHCAGWKPIVMRSADALTDHTRKAIIAHDEYGAKSGCWTAPGGGT